MIYPCYFTFPFLLSRLILTVIVKTIVSFDTKQFSTSDLILKKHKYRIPKELQKLK